MRDLPWYGYIVIAVIIFGLFFVLYYRPKDNELKNIRTERETTEAEVARLKVKQDELERMEKELEVMNVQLRDLSTIIPDKEEIDVILRRIQQMAYDSRINMPKFIPKNLIEKEFFSEKPITMELTGSYHNLAIFFNRLGNFSRLFNIENFTIKAIRDQTESTSITASSTVKTYIFKEPPPEEETNQKAGAKK